MDEGGPDRLWESEILPLALTYPEGGSCENGLSSSTDSCKTAAGGRSFAVGLM
jgi:hypothetical protein